MTSALVRVTKPASSSVHASLASIAVHTIITMAVSNIKNKDLKRSGATLCIDN